MGISLLAPRTGPRRTIAWLRPLPFALGVGYALAQGRAPVDLAAPSRSAALASILATQGIDAAPSDVVWLEGSKGSVWSTLTARTWALVRGVPHDEATEDEGDDGAPELHDLYLVDARLTPEGSLLDVGDAHNLTRTSGGDEGLPVVFGMRAAYVLFEDGVPGTVHALDLEGHPAAAYAELSRFQRWQVAVTNWQDTGAFAGIARTVFHLPGPATQCSLAFTNEGQLSVTTDGGSTLLDAFAAPSPEVSANGFRATREEIAKPATFAPWMSERLRAVSWFGDEKNQALKAVVFGARALVSDWKTRIFGDTSASDVEDDMGALRASGHAPVTFADPDLRWPPKKLTPTIKPSLPGEGEWVTLDGDPFIGTAKGEGSPFATTFVRSDPSALQTRVYITLWDPRRIALHMVAGTIEPVSATGEVGPGRIPREKSTLQHVVAGFNGGFQATHGQFGMQADGTLYLPPKPYAATVMELRDGSTAFGAWPTGPGKGASPIPEEVVSFRQNLTPLVQNDKWNPWGRTWWGGVPPGWHDAVHTTRSGLCLTKDGFVGYFWGNDIAAEPLGRAMLAAQCTFGMHLDMNPGLAGFEFFNVQSTSNFEPLGRPLQPDWEFEGGLKDVPEIRYRSRRMVKSMGHILFPRYLHRDGRDFFYLTTRDVLPGAPLPSPGAPPIAEAEPWRVRGLPQHGYPYAIATAGVVLPRGIRAQVLRVDPRAVEVRTESSPPEGVETKLSDTVVAFGAVAGPQGSGRASNARNTPRSAPNTVLTFQRGRFEITASKAPDAVLLAPVYAVTDRGGAGPEPARAVVGVSSEGFLQWIELAPTETPDRATTRELLDALDGIGCTTKAVVGGDVRALLGGELDLTGQAIAKEGSLVRLARARSPGAQLLFDTPVVPFAVWQPLQAQRVKWRPTKAPPETPAATGADAGAGPLPANPAIPGAQP